MLGTTLKFISILEEHLDDVQSTVHTQPVHAAFLYVPHRKLADSF